MKLLKVENKLVSLDNLYMIDLDYDTLYFKDGAEIDYAEDINVKVLNREELANKLGSGWLDISTLDKDNDAFVLLEAIKYINIEDSQEDSLVISIILSYNDQTIENLEISKIAFYNFSALFDVSEIFIKKCDDSEEEEYSEAEENEEIVEDSTAISSQKRSMLRKTEKKPWYSKLF